MKRLAATRVIGKKMRTGKKENEGEGLSLYRKHSLSEYYLEENFSSFKRPPETYKASFKVRQEREVLLKALSSKRLNEQRIA